MGQCGLRVADCWMGLFWVVSPLLAMHVHVHAINLLCLLLSTVEHTATPPISQLPSTAHYLHLNLQHTDRPFSTNCLHISRADYHLQCIDPLHILITTISIIMKKKYSLVIRRKPVRKHNQQQQHSPPTTTDEQQCHSAKQYLFSLNEQPSHCQRHYKLRLLDTNRYQQDHSISQWDDSQSHEYTHASPFQDTFNLAVSPKQQRFRIRTEHTNGELLKMKLEAQLRNTPSLLSSKSKIQGRADRCQNLSQLEIVSPITKPVSSEQLSTISHKNQCINTVKLMFKDHKVKAKIKVNTEPLAVSTFFHELDKTQTTPLAFNKNASALPKSSGQAPSIFQRTKECGKKKFDILFVRHKLRRCQGAWGERYKEKDFFQIDGHSWVSNDKLK